MKRAETHSFLADPSNPQSALNAIPKEVLLRAKGLAIFTVVKAGFVWSGKIGSGIVIARTDDGSWSAPSCIATGGVGFGFQAGADISEVRISVYLIERSSGRVCLTRRRALSLCSTDATHRRHPQHCENCSSSSCSTLPTPSRLSQRGAT